MTLIQRHMSTETNGKLLYSEYVSISCLASGTINVSWSPT